ncbi:transposase [Nocardia takedensis]
MAGRKYTQQQKDEFFRVLDRGGTVRAAARAVSIPENAGYNWLNRTGLTMQRTTPRVYSAELKAEFLRLVRERQIISTVARELGIHRPTAYAWARKAGISTSEARKVNPRREEFLRLRAAGLTRAQARERVGADARSATDWDKGITIIHRGRVYPDGRVVRYPERNNGGVPERRSRAIGGSVDLDVVEKVIHHRYLGLVEREQLQDLRRSGLTIRKIASVPVDPECMPGSSIVCSRASTAVARRDCDRRCRSRANLAGPLSPRLPMVESTSDAYEARLRAIPASATASVFMISEVAWADLLGVPPQLTALGFRHRTRSKPRWAWLPGVQARAVSTSTLDT